MLKQAGLFECSVFEKVATEFCRIYISFLSAVDVIAKFAQLEFRYGDAEKGRNMLDKVLTSYPKRTDLWSIFIDLVIKHGSQKDVR